jgi:hypothetical protein
VALERYRDVFTSQRTLIHGSGTRYYFVQCDFCSEVVGAVFYPEKRRALAYWHTRRFHRQSLKELFPRGRPPARDIAPVKQASRCRS